MIESAPVRFFARCQNCRAAYVATLSRFTPWVCKKCGYDHGVKGTSLEYGEQMHNPADLAMYPVSPRQEAEPPPDPPRPVPPPPARRRRPAEMVVEGDGDSGAWVVLVGLAGLLYLLYTLGVF